MGRATSDRSQDGALTRLLRLVTRAAARRPKGTLCLVLLSLLLCAGLTAVGLKFKTSRADLIDPDAIFQQRWRAFTEQFGEQSDIVVVVESDAPARVQTALDSLGAALDAEPELFARTSWKTDVRRLRRKGLQYLSPRQLEEGLQRLESYGPVLEGQWQRAGLESYCRRLAIHARWAHDQGLAEDEAQAIRQAARLTESLTAFTGAPADRFDSPWPELLPGAAEAADALTGVRYHVSDDGRMGFLTTVPATTEQDFSGSSPALTRLRTILDASRAEFPGVTFGLTGIPVLESDEMQRSQDDMSRASLISFAGVAFILLVGFRGFRHPMLGLLMLVVGLTWSIGYTTLAVGHLNILSVSFAAILIGLGIDFAIHYLARYLELRHSDLDLGDALEETSATVGTGLATAAITTAIAFLCAGFTRFLGVAELGIIAGGGILLCAAATFLTLVPLIRVSDQAIEPRRLPEPFQGTLLRWLTGRFPWTVTLASGALVAAVIVQAFGWQEGRPVVKVEYDANLLNLQADDVESVAVQQRVFQQAQGSILYAVSLTDGPDSARLRADQFRRLDGVAHVEHLAEVFPEYAPAETALLIQAIQARLSRLAPLPRELPAIDPLDIGKALEDLLTLLKSSSLPEATAAAAHLDGYLDRFEQHPLEHQLELLNGYQLAMLTALRGQFAAIVAAADPTPVSIQDVDSAMRSRFVSGDGQWMLRVFPSEQVWDEEPLERFVTQVRSIDPEATGTPLQNYEAARQIRQSYINAALYAFLAVCLVLLIDALASGPLCVALLTPLIVVSFGVVTLSKADQVLDVRWMMCLYVGLALATAAIFDFPNVRNMLLSMTPAVIGLAMMFGVLGYLGEHLNPANIIVLPLLLGIGVDDGVHVLHDFRLQKNGYRTSASTINAVVLTSLTSMTGVGSLLLASHRGLQSLGLVLVVGVATCLFVSLVALPAVLTLIAGRPRAETETADEPAIADGSQPVLLPLPTPVSQDRSPVGRNLRAAS